MMENLRQQKKANNPLNLEYYNKRYPELSITEREKMWHDYVKAKNFQCIEYYNEKYPDLTQEERDKMLADAIKNYTSKRDESGEKNGMHRSKTTDLQRRQISPRCIEFYQLKYPNASDEEHKQMLLDFQAKNREKIKLAIKDTNIEYYLNRGMSIEEARLALHNRQATFTLEKCIAKYGEEEGLIKFKARQEKWLKSVHAAYKAENKHYGNAFQSRLGHKIISQLCKHLEIEVPKYEKCLTNTERCFFYDFTFNNKIIEIQGDYWHCNPKLYDEDFFHKVKNCLAKDVWQEDNKKKLVAESYGYEVMYVWENDYNADPEREIQRCVEFLTK